jgi:predicted NodU family carbamoyl transferase
MLTFERALWIQPAAGDAGGALGAALATYYSLLNNGRDANGCCDRMKGSTPLSAKRKRDSDRESTIKKRPADKLWPHVH